MVVGVDARGGGCHHSRMHSHAQRARLWAPFFLGLLLMTSCKSPELVPPPIVPPAPVNNVPPQSPGPECRWASGPIAIDGKSDEPAWAGAAVFENYRQHWLGTNAAPVKTKTRTRLLWDSEYLYFTAEMEDADLFADVTEHDGDTWYNDVWELFLKPAGDHGYYEFHVNAANTKFDLYLPHRGAWLVQRLRRAHEFHIESNVTRRGTLNDLTDRDEGWTVEGRIPWSDFKMSGGAPKPGDTWTFALCRYDYSVGAEKPELSSTAPYRRLDFHRHEDFVYLRFVPQEANRFGSLKRAPWQVSRVKGSPEPPLPYVTERVWEQLPVKKPLELKRVPGMDGKLAYLDHRQDKDGYSKLWFFDDSAGVTEQAQALALPNELAYGFCFHPKFLKNGHVYIHTSGPRSGEGSKKKKCRVSRWTIDRKTLKADPNSRLVILEWESNGHDGGGVVFGLDGMLYITTGDGTSDSDDNVTGQRIDLLLSKLLRINVDKPADGRPYSIPPDNPFLDTPNARPETWAHGFRNPWRVTCDEKTGHIWVGENGQDLWESAKLVEKGANYGWSVYEGSHPFYLERKLGPGKLRQPTVEHHHREARSLTGGVVYYGDVIPQLRGAYVYGDYSTGKVWAVKHNGEELLWHKEIADTTFQITGFGVDTRGNLLVIDETTGFHKFTPNPNAGRKSDFPARLSQTGLFDNTRRLQPHPALLPYSVNLPHWNDGAEAEHYIALPGDTNTTMGFSGGAWNLPEGSVLVQTLTLRGRRIETRLLTRQQKEWVGYSYEWNAAQTDATLVPSEGVDRELDIKGVKQKWRIPGRAECMMCHSRAARYVLGLNELQMNRVHDYGDFKAHQFQVLSQLGALKGAKWSDYTGNGNSKKMERRLTPPADNTRPLEARVRSYWAANCAHCHVEAGGGNAQMKLDFNTPLDKTKTLDAEPVHARFDLGDDARIITPGNPAKSVMLTRITTPATGRMPPVGPSTLDPQWVTLLVKWITETKPPPAPPPE